MKLFTPDYYVESYRAIDLERLKRQGIALLVCDIDNTLVPHDHARADDDVRAFIKRVKDSGLAVAFVSNNVKERVETFASEFHAPCYPFAKKPLKRTYRKMMNDLGYRSDQIAVLGDQLLTDMLGANRMHFYTILTNPVAKRDLKCTKVNRVFEQMIFSLLEKRGKLKRGNYDDKVL